MISKEEALKEAKRRGLIKEDEAPISKEEALEEAKRRGLIIDEDYIDTFKDPGRKLKRAGRNLAVGAASVADLPNLVALGAHAAGLKKDPTFYDSIGDKTRNKIDEWTDDELKPRNKGEEYEDAITEGAAFGLPGIVRKGAAIVAAKGLTKGVLKGTGKSAASNVGSSAATKAYIDNVDDPSVLGALAAGVAGGNVHNLGKLNRAVLKRIIAKDPEAAKDIKSLNKALIEAGEEPLSHSVLEGSDFHKGDDAARHGHKAERLSKIIKGEDHVPLEAFFEDGKRHIKESVPDREIDLKELAKRKKESARKAAEEKPKEHKKSLKEEWAEQDAALIKSVKDKDYNQSPGYNPHDLEDYISEIHAKTGRSPIAMDDAELVHDLMEKNKYNALMRQSPEMQKLIKESSVDHFRKKEHKEPRYEPTPEALREMKERVAELRAKKRKILTELDEVETKTPEPIKEIKRKALSRMSDSMKEVDSGHVDIGEVFESPKKMALLKATVKSVEESRDLGRAILGKLGGDIEEIAVKFKELPEALQREILGFFPSKEREQIAEALAYSKRLKVKDAEVDKPMFKNYQPTGLPGLGAVAMRKVANAASKQAKHQLSESMYEPRSKGLMGETLRTARELRPASEVQKERERPRKKLHIDTANRRAYYK